MLNQKDDKIPGLTILIRKALVYDLLLKISGIPQKDDQAISLQPLISLMCGSDLAPSSGEGVEVGYSTHLKDRQFIEKMLKGETYKIYTGRAPISNAYKQRL